MNSLIADLRYAGRELRRRPGFSLTAVISLALGIGTTSTVFSVVYGVLINPFPYVGADRMMQLAVRDNAGRFRYPGANGVQLEELRQAGGLESVVAEEGWNLTTTDGDIPEDVAASYISPNAPNHWGVPALMGRWLIPADAPPGQDLQGWITNLPEYAQQKLVARLFGIFSLLALALSAVGLYSVVSYGVATRTNEFGIRMALGASARDVVRLVLSGTGWTVGAGLIAGMVLCLAFDRVTSRWVTETSRDPAIVAGVTSLLLAVAALACLAPARRAASIDPMEAVRHE